MLRFQFRPLILLSGVLLAGAAQAQLSGTVLTAPGTTVFPGLVPPGTDAGTLLASLTSQWSFSTTAGTTSGTFDTEVFRNATGTLDFYYQVSNDATSATSIARETNTSFTGFATYTGYRTDGSTLVGGTFADGSVAPVTADRNSGSVVGFSFDPLDSEKISPGSASNVLVISTNATSFNAGNSSLIDGGATTVSAFEPVPEPASFGVFALGLLTLVRRRARKKA